jgi:hypothetical protein
MRKYYQINSIFEGWQPVTVAGKPGQFLTSIGIDPDVPLSDVSTDIKTAGVLRPVKYAKFSGSNVTSYPIAIIKNPKNALTYTVLSNGRLISYDSAQASETLVGTCAGSSARGAFYYNNYIYILGTGASHDDASRYGPLDNSPALTDGVWKGATLGSQTALTDTTYPTTRNSVSYLNHAHYVHVDNKAYFVDFKNGQAYIHYIKTQKVTDEGDTNNGSTYGSPSGASFLPFNYYPTAIWGFGNDIVIAASPTTNGTLDQGGAELFFWDTTSSNFYRRVLVGGDPICTVVRYHNGILKGVSGSLAGGVRHWQYLGGDQIETLKYIEEGNPPLQNAADIFGERFVWGGYQTYPDFAAGLFAYGSKSDLVPRGLHQIAVSSLTATSSNGVITAVCAAIQGGAFPKFLMGGTDGTNNNIDSKSTTYGTHYFRSELFNIGRSFAVAFVALRLGAAVAANHTLTAKLFFDNESSSQAVNAANVINNTNLTQSERYKVLSQDSFDNNVSGINNFELELKWSGTALLPVLLPIIIAVDISDNENE